MIRSKTNSKIIALCLAFALAFGVFVGMPITASAAPIGLSAPTNPHWDGETGYAVWDNVPESGEVDRISYHWRLYKVGTTGAVDSSRIGSNDRGEPQFRVPLASYFTENGEYYFEVCALGDGLNYSDSEYSVASDTFTYSKPTAKLPTPTGLKWASDDKGYFATFENFNSDMYADDDCFSVHCYDESGTHVEGNIFPKKEILEKGYPGVPLDDFPTANTKYRFTVQVDSSRPNEYQSSDVSDYSDWLDTAAPTDPDPVKLPAPTNPHWEINSDGKYTGNAVWNIVPNSGADDTSQFYHWILYRPDGTTDEKDTSGSIGMNPFWTNLSSFLTVEGDYYFKVRAVGNGLDYSDSEYSVASDIFTYVKPTAKLPTPTGLKLATDGSQYYVAWDNLDVYADEDSFTVRVYDASGAQLEASSGIKKELIDYNMLGLRIGKHFDVTAGTYYYTIQANSSRPLEYLSSDVSAKVALSIDTTRKLSTPTNLAWESNATAAWDAVPNSDGTYLALLYHNGKQVSSSRFTRSTSLVRITNSYADRISEIGTYYFTVKAIGSNGYADSDVARSPDWVIREGDLATERLPAPTNLTWGDDNGRPYAKWDAVPGAATYEIRLEFNGRDVGSSWAPMNRSSATESTFPSYIDLNAPGSYVFTVQAVSGNITTFLSSDFASSNTRVVGSTGSGNDKGGSSGGGSSGGGTSSGSYTPPGTPVDVTPAAASNAAQSALEKAASAGSGSATANIRNPGKISLTTLTAMANSASEAGLPLKLQADSMAANGTTVDVRITLDPSLASKDLNLSASTSNSQAKATTNFFEKHFSNDLMTVSLGQQGSFGQPVSIAAKLDPKLNTENLVFYSYNKETNTYSRIPAPKYWVDKNGYVHFTTQLGGSIIISDGKLTK